MAGEFKWVHNMAIDSKGNLYTAEVGLAGVRRNSPSCRSSLYCKSGGRHEDRAARAPCIKGT